MMNRLALLPIAALALGLSACIPLENGTTTSTVSGTVNTQSFTVVSGSAESLSGQYVITLADTSEFSCTSTAALPPDYLTVVISEIDEAPKTFDAAETVFFNSYRDSVGVPEAAQSGTVTIDAIDDFGGVIEGSLDATGPNSSVSGTFSVEICQ